MAMRGNINTEISDAIAAIDAMGRGHRVGSAVRPVDIAHGRAPMAPLGERLRAVADWNLRAADAADKSAAAHRRRAHVNLAAQRAADAARHRMNVVECRTALAGVLADVRRAA